MSLQVARAYPQVRRIPSVAAGSTGDPRSDDQLGMGRVVQSHGLPRRDAALGSVEADAQALVAAVAATAAIAFAAVAIAGASEHASHRNAVGTALGDRRCALRPRLVAPR